MSDKKKIFFGEFIGTFILVFFGCGVVASSVLAKVQVGIWQVAVVWGIAVSLGIYVSQNFSNSHLNPAVTLAFLVWKKFADLNTALLYMSSQLAGAIAAGGIVFILFKNVISAFEKTQGIIRGNSGSELSAMMFGEYFPNPALDSSIKSLFTVSPAHAIFAEALGTALLVLVIFSVTSSENFKFLQPILIGSTVAIIISIIAPFTQAGLNPARDFGPRLVSYFAGWGHIAIPGPGSGFYVYIVGPVIGGLLGGGFFELIHRSLKH